VTNNLFERVFINLDDKKQEQRSFSMLEIKQVGLYWNSAAQDNWSKSKEFGSSSAQKLIDFSRKYVETLKKRFYQYQ
jgi:hypothetical protein